MRLEDVQAMRARDLAAGLKDLDIASGWEIGDRARVAAPTAPSELWRLEPAKRRVEAFQNLVVSCCTYRTERGKT